MFCCLCEASAALGPRRLSGYQPTRSGAAVIAVSSWRGTPYNTNWDHPWCFMAVTFGFHFPNVAYFPNCHEALSVVHLLFSLSSGVRLAKVTVIFSSSFLSSPHFSLSVLSINSLQLLLSLTFVLHSPPTLSRSLLTQSSHRILGLPRLLSPPFSGYLLFPPIVLYILIIRTNDTLCVGCVKW